MARSTVVISHRKAHNLPAFIEGDLDIPRHLARRVHELSTHPERKEKIKHELLRRLLCRQRCEKRSQSSRRLELRDRIELLERRSKSVRRTPDGSGLELFMLRVEVEVIGTSRTVWLGFVETVIPDRRTLQLAPIFVLRQAIVTPPRPEALASDALSCRPFPCLCGHRLRGTSTGQAQLTACRRLR
jgi:hypothetical protein